MLYEPRIALPYEEGCESFKGSLRRDITVAYLPYGVEGGGWGAKSGLP